MAELIMSEQDIVNAICIDQAWKNEDLLPENVEVELIYDDDEGFSAEVEIPNQNYVLGSFDMIQSIRFYIKEVLQQDPYAASIKLLLDREEGIIASIQ
ncbi:hypothetical protein SLU01_08410 [Sporosarcina luteola]|uniref:DUF2653 domain-containing protein n=1 Tax=Sporosarcina luteola TaxID=582850 RepID=A0A511Z516_9BACL|nr:DUF2653 family protein [Sporosarcina luteola]GEN82529.1 hypothetical protein SLU01_08410 [Sporosarcina luteola]